MYRWGVFAPRLERRRVNTQNQGREVNSPQAYILLHNSWTITDFENSFGDFSQTFAPHMIVLLSSWYDVITWRGDVILT